MSAIDVIVVNWNGRRHLERCLPGLEAQSYPHVRVILVDNASTDNSVDWVGRHHPEVHVIQAGANLGFAAGNNLGLAASTTEHVALINADATPEPGWLAESAAAMLAPDVAGVASLMVFDGRPDVVNSTGIALDPAGIAWDRHGGAPVKNSAVQTAGEVFGPSAGAALYRRAALEDVAETAGGTATIFDPAFFMYLEDVDLAWRLRLRGWRSVYAPTARVAHVGSGTSGEGSPFKNRLLARNKVWSVLKCYPGRPLVLRAPLVVGYDVAAIPYRLLVQGQPAALLGRIDATRRLPAVLRQRRAIQGRRKATWAQLASAMEPLAPPWAVLTRYRHLRPRSR